MYRLVEVKILYSFEEWEKRVKKAGKCKCIQAYPRHRCSTFTCGYFKTSKSAYKHVPEGKEIYYHRYNQIYQLPDFGIGRI